MNEKLKAFARTSVLGSRRITRSPARNILIQVSKRNKPTDPHVLDFSLHPRAVGMLGWQKGDRIDLEVLDTGALVLFRSLENGRKLVQGWAPPTRRDPSPPRCHVRFRVREDFFNAVDAGVGRDVEIDSGRIAFDLPAKLDG